MHLLQDLRHGIRLLRRTPGFTAVAVIVLALAIGANTAVFALVNILVLQPRPGRIDQLVGVFSRDRVRQDRWRDFSYGTYVDLRERGDIFESLMAHTFSLVGISESPGSDARSEPSATKRSFAVLVSANYFSTLGVPLAAGRPFTLDEERPGANARVAIASYTVWRRARFDPSLVGRSVRVNGSDFTIVGVAPRGFGGTMTLISPEWWFPIGSYDLVVAEMFRNRSTGLDDRGNTALNLAGALRPGLTRAAAEQALDLVGKRLSDEYPATDKDQTFVLSGLPRMGVSTRPQGDGPIGAFSALITFMAALVLAVACLNLANLLLARGVARRKEIAIRQALGSGRARIVQQLLVEGFTLALCGAAAGIVLGWWTTGALGAWFASVMPVGFEIVVEPSAKLIPAAIAFAVFSTLCFALGPAWALSRPAVSADLKGEPGYTRRLSRRFGTGSLLVVGQLAVSLALVAAGGLFVRAALNAARLDAGFSMDRHLIAALDPSLAGYDATRTRGIYRSLLARIRSLPGVEHASTASLVPFGEFREGREVRLKPGDEPVGADFLIVGAHYFDTMGMHLLRGRDFTLSEEEPSPGLNTAIIDRPMARRLFGDGDPLGRQILTEAHGGASMEPSVVVGVVSEMRHDLFDTEPRPHVFVPTGAIYRPGLVLQVRTAAGAPETAMLATVRRELTAIDPRLPILAMRTMAEHRYRSFTEWSMRAAAAIFSTFGLVALLLATVGAYGLKAYEVSRRTREIGIRMALGATGRDVVRLVVGEGTRATILAVAAGLLLAAGVGKLASGLLYQVSPFDPITLMVASAILGSAALLASYLPARRATRVVPVEALRTE